MFNLFTFCTRSCDRFLQQSFGKLTAVLQVRYARTKALQNLPEKPKRPPSSWLLFLSERRNELRQHTEFENLSLMEMSKKISEEWRNFDDLDKIPYKEKYEESLGDYTRKMREYKVNLTAEDKRILRRIKANGKQDVRAFEKLFPKPKYPGNGYILFVKDCLSEHPREDKDMKDWIRECARRWQNLDEETKLRLNEQASPLMRKYREELREWKEKYEEWKKSDAPSN